MLEVLAAVLPRVKLILMEGAGGQGIVRAPFIPLLGSWVGQCVRPSSHWL